MMKLFFRSAASAILATGLVILSGGCVLTPNSHYESKTFDLAMPTEPTTQSLFRISLFQNNTPSRNRMLYRNQDNRIIQDEYNSWVQTPELMLQRYLQLAYPLDPEAEVRDLPELRIHITAFEFNLATSEAILVLNYNFRSQYNKVQGSLTFREKFSSRTPEAMAEAMNKAAAAAGEKLFLAAKNFAAKNK